MFESFLVDAGFILRVQTYKENIGEGGDSYLVLL